MVEGKRFEFISGLWPDKEAKTTVNALSKTSKVYSSPKNDSNDK